MLDVSSHERASRPNHSGEFLNGPRKVGRRDGISSASVGFTAEAPLAGMTAAPAPQKTAARWSALGKGEVVLLA
jgi:hypothetical protein